MTLLDIEIPNLFETPYVTIPQDIGNEIYYFEYFWNIRHERAYLSIYLLDSDIQTYLVKNIMLTNLLEISKHIINDRWVGGLFFNSKNLGAEDYNIKNISTDYYLFYNSEYIRD